jgi:hypothetical protein
MAIIEFHTCRGDTQAKAQRKDRWIMPTELQPSPATETATSPKGRGD